MQNASALVTPIIAWPEFYRFYFVGWMRGLFNWFPQLILALSASTGSLVVALLVIFVSPFLLAYLAERCAAFLGHAAPRSPVAVFCICAPTPNADRPHDAAVLLLS